MSTRPQPRDGDVSRSLRGAVLHELESPTPLPHALELPVLGIGVRFETNSPVVLMHVEQSFGSWRALPPVRPATVAVRIFVASAPAPAGPRAPFHYDTSQPDRVSIAAPDSFGVADAKLQRAVAHVTDALVADGAHFRYGLLESLTWVILTRLDRMPFHAAAVVRADTALLLWGRSGSGKSTLTYAAARSGYRLLAEDVTFLQQQPRLRIWGMSAQVHLPPDVTAHFPELHGESAVVRANGKTKLAAAVPQAPRVPYAERGVLCVLGERRDTPALQHLGAAELLSRIDLAGESGFDVFAAAIRPAVQCLAQPGGWLLHPASEPFASLPLFEQMLLDVH